MSAFPRDRSSRRPSTFQRRVEIIVAVVAAVAVALVYSATHWIAPALFSHFEYAPELAGLPKRATTRHHARGDPINIAIVGTQAELEEAMRAAGWVQADRAARASDIAIARSVLLDRPDSTAPVSPLYLFDRPQDFSFEREVGRSARSRHHARFWLARGVRHGGRPVWLGDATFDVRAGVTSTLIPTHHIAPDVDEERDTLVANLASARRADTVFTVSGMGIRVESHNAGGDRFDTDGEMDVVILSPDNELAAHTDTLPEPPVVMAKDRFWRWVHAH